MHLFSHTSSAALRTVSILLAQDNSADIKCSTHSAFVSYFSNSDFTACTHEMSPSEWWRVFQLFACFPPGVQTEPAFCLLNVSSSVAFVMHPSVFGCTGRSYRSKHDLQTTAFLCATEGKQRSTAELPQSCQEELIFPFSLSPWGFVVDVRTCMKKSQPDMFIFHLWRRASSRAPNNTQSAFFFALLSRGQRKGDTNEMRKKCCMKTPAVVWPIKNVHFLNAIRRKTELVCVYKRAVGSHGDGGCI